MKELKSLNKSKTTPNAKKQIPKVITEQFVLYAQM